MTRRVPAWLALPAVAGLLLFLVYPTVYLVALALTDSSLANPLRAFSGADNLTAALAAPAFVPSLVRSTVFSVAATAATTGLGLALALLLRARGTRFGAVGALLLLPLVTAPVLVGVAWKLLLAPVGGGLADVFAAVGLAGFNPLGHGVGAYVTVLAIHTWQWTPFATLILFAALGVVRPELVESARIDGAGPRRVFTTVTWPAIAPTVWAVLVLQLVIGYKVFDLIVVLTSGGPGFATALTPFVVYQTGLRGSFDMGAAAVQTLLFALLVGAGATAFTAARARTVARGARVTALRRPAVYLALTLAVGVALLPLAYLVSLAVRPPGDVLNSSLLPTELTWANVTSVFDTIALSTMLGNSWITATGAAVLATLIATPAAYVTARHVRGERLLTALLASYCAPPIVAIIPLFFLLRDLGLTNSALGLVLVNGIANVPVAAWLLDGFVRRIPVEIDEAAVVDGLSAAGAFFKAVLPLLLPGVVAALLVVFFLSYNDFLFAVYLAVTRESQTLTVGLSLFQGDRNVQFGQQAAAGLLGIAPVWVLALLAQRYLVGGLATGATK